MFIDGFGSGNTVTLLANISNANLLLQHVHIQAQDQNYQHTPPGRTQIQAIIIQTPHHFNIAATPIYNQPPHMINYSIQAESIAAIVEPSDNSELEDGRTEDLCLPQKQSKSAS